MPLLGMCAIGERPAGAGPSVRNGQSRWLLSGAQVEGITFMPCWDPSLYIAHIAKGATSVPPSQLSGLTGCLV
jgi:hypothetical protein